MRFKGGARIAAAIATNSADQSRPLRLHSGLTEFGSIRVAGEFLCGTEARE
jgi:hypothetical protein